MKSDNWLTKICQNKPMPLPSAVGTEPGLGAGAIDRSMNQQTADAIKQEHPEMRWLGRGNSGVAYECKPGVVCKITDKPIEATRALYFKQNPHPNVVGILDVKKVQDYPQLWVVYAELINSMSAEQVDICESLEDCYNYSYWSLDMPCIAIKTRKLIANGQNPEVVKRLAEDYTEICNIKEIRPADPHPDNLGISKQGRLVIFDLG